MGSDPSKYADDDDQFDRYAQLAKRLAKERDHSQNYDDDDDGISDDLIFVQRNDQRYSNKNDKKEIEIDGVIYDIIEFVNKGGFGEIYKGYSKLNKQKVAIKIMSNTPDIREEIQNEIHFLRLTKTIRLTNHPIIDYYGCKITNDKIYIVMELALCDLLTFWFNYVQTKDSKEKFLIGIRIIVNVLRALIFLEKLNIIHGDIKPQNLVIVQASKYFTIKLIDFGTVEKMSTIRNQLTVDAGKAHTVFFASPEFLKRDSNNMITRHLHRKSDAWAAGVMFYILFYQKFPWKDQFDYENFCNNPRAKDIIVPQHGGYKLIIELLLKKDPKQRSTAKQTFMQIKSHPDLGTILRSIEQTSFPLDDVCHINVPDQLRQQLGKLARPSNSSRGPNRSLSRDASQPRRSCRYGKECNRNDRDHQEEFSHPDDPDYHSTNSTNDKPMCKYGRQCYRKDPEHRQKYIHPKQTDEKSFPKSNSHQIPCRYGINCFKDNDPEHLQKYSHPNCQRIRPSSAIPFNGDNRPTCHFGSACTKRAERDHMNKFKHN